MKLTQNEFIFESLKNGPMTTKDANKFGITRLSARIYDIKNEGHGISSEMIKVKSRWGDTWVCRYQLEED